MARMNAPLNAWVVELLDVGPDDSVLEIGFGPGLALSMAAERATRGHVAGVEKSSVMLRHARWRNRLAARNGRLDLRLGSAESLPFPDASFTRACSVNSLQFWPDVGRGLSEIHRVLQPGGRVVIAQRMFRDGGGRTDRRRFGMTEENLDQLAQRLGTAELAVERIERRDIRDETIAALIARRLTGGPR